MDETQDLRERLVGQRFYDKSQEEAFTVVGITGGVALALLQYDDGVAWDEGASNFTVSEDVAAMAGLNEHGLDSKRYQALGSGPRIDQICEADTHDWYPWPDELWPSGPSKEVWEQLSDHPRDFYGWIVRCKRCGLSGDVASQFGFYGSHSGGDHSPPWFCSECSEAYADAELVYLGDFPYCRTCEDKLNQPESGE